MRIYMTIDDALTSKRNMDKAIEEFKRQVIYNALVRNYMEKEDAFVENFNLIERCLEQGIIDSDEEYIKMNERIGTEVGYVKRRCN